MGHLVALVGQSVQLGTNKASTKNLNPLSFDQFCRLGGIALNFSILAPLYLRISSIQWDPR
jgi:hypothetical protein